MTSAVPALRLRRLDVALLTAYCVLLFGVSLVGGRALTVHEARLPQTSREMLVDHDWLVPKSGGRPWMERPPLPHWVTVACVEALGVSDQVWVYRIPPALMATLAVLATAWCASVWFGRGQGLLAGLVLATSFQFLRYAWLAEEEAFLAAVMAGVVALFVKLEFTEAGRRTKTRAGDDHAHVGATFTESVAVLGTRPWLVLAFFVALGLTNLVKGLLFAAALCIAATGSYMLVNRDWLALRRYLWFWGWAAFLGTAVLWPIAALSRYPDVAGIMGLDLGGRLVGGYIGRSPVWQYFAELLWVMIPWTPAVIVAFVATARTAWDRPGSPERFLWCWALAPVLVLSIPNGKHHHYLVPLMAPFAILGSLGAVRIWESIPSWPSYLRNPWIAPLAASVPVSIALFIFGDRLPGPMWVATSLAIGLPFAAYGLHQLLLARDPQYTAAGVFAMIFGLYAFGHIYAGQYIDKHKADADFLVNVVAHESPAEPVYLFTDREALEPFRQMFYLGERAKLLHNLTFLRDDRIHSSSVLVLARYCDRERLDDYGNWETVARSEGLAHIGKDRCWTLFRVHFHDDLARYPGDVPITPAQAYLVKPGPFLGDPPTVRR